MVWRRFRFFRSKEVGYNARPSNVDNINNVWLEANRHVRNKKKNLKAKIEELETNREINNIGDSNRGINDFKKGYQPRMI